MHQAHAAHLGWKLEGMKDCHTCPSQRKELLYTDRNRQQHGLSTLGMDVTTSGVGGSQPNLMERGDSLAEKHLAEDSEL